MNGEHDPNQPPAQEAPAPPRPEVVRPNVEDIPDLLDLWQQQYDYHHDLDPAYYVPFTDELRVQLEADLLEMIEAEESHILVAKDGTSVLGFITFGRDQDDYYDANIRDYGVLKELLVTEGARGRGVGRELVTTVEEHFRAQGVSDIMIQCSSFNANALAVYNAMGYTIRQELLYKKLTADSA